MAEQESESKKPRNNSRDEDTVVPIYMEYLALPEDQRAKLPQPFLTVRWWDPPEFRTLTSQSWFSQLRDQLNRGGKVSINLGIWKYEQAGVPTETDSKTFEFVRSVFEKTKPVAVEDVRRRLEEATRAPVFEPSLVVIDGELILALAAYKYAQSLLIEVADALGLDARPREEGKYVSGKLVDQCVRPLMHLVELLGGDAQELSDYWKQDPDNLLPMRFRGQDLIQAFLLGSDRRGEAEIRFAVAFPPEAVPHFAELSGYGARILGWLEHGRPAEFFVRAIAIATVDFVHFHAQE